MKKLINHGRALVHSVSGPTAPEYAVLVALIIMVCLTTIGHVGTQANATFQAVGSGLAL